MLSLVNKNINQLADVKFDDDELKELLLSESRNFFDIRHKKNNKFLDFSENVKQGLAKNSLAKNQKPKPKKYFFQTSKADCKPRKKDSANVYIYLWFVLFIIIFAFLMF